MATTNKANAMAQIVAQNDVAQEIVKADVMQAIAKKDEKKAAPAKARTTRPAQPKQETTAPAATVAAATVKAMPVKYKVNANLRAAQDNRLYSHTEAFLQLFGMYGKGTMARTVLDDIMGGKTTANYHIKKGRFIEGKNGLSLTTEGKEWFKGRGTPAGSGGVKFNPQDVEAYKEILTTGKDSSGRIINDKNKHLVTAFTTK